MSIANDVASTHTKKILFLTNSETGQANTILAMTLEAVTRPHVQVHIGSFPVLKQRVEKLSPKINFHALDGVEMVKSMRSKGFTEGGMPHPPTRTSFEAFGRNMALALVGWEGEGAFFSYSLDVGGVSDDDAVWPSLYADL